MSKKIFVSGLINIETSVKIAEFPINYIPISFEFFGIETTVSGVGVNLAKALTKLGSNIDFISILGNDENKDIALNHLKSHGINTEGIKSIIDYTPQSIVLFDDKGKRKIICDLKDIQESIFPKDIAIEKINNCEIAVLCNINFSRPMLAEAKKANKLIATDVHVVSDINDSYNQEFMKYADILFLSNENIESYEKDFVRKIINSYGNDIVVVGMGNKGALLYTRESKSFELLPSIEVEKIVNTCGAGDALFASFIHFYNKTRDPYGSLQKAVFFAAHKIGFKGGADGFLDESSLLRRHFPSQET